MDKFAKNNGYKKVQGEKIQGQQVYFNKKALQNILLDQIHPIVATL
ncbi:hypothetical protein [uncultured Gammaproteobacteria bacterium]|nr:hypothetical protein [uncultured Gammaproteobacteria bacterium]